MLASRRGRAVASLLAASLAGASLLWIDAADAAIVPTVPLATAAAYSVVGGSTVTNTNATVLNGSLGLWPGPAVTGFPPGQVVAPATQNINNPAAQQAQADITTAYNDAAGRPLTATTAADLTNLVLPGGVYAGPSKGALLLSGSLVLDGAGNPDSVFIFQTDSMLTTATGSTVSLINGAQACNVFWQIGSSATLGTSSTFIGTILALTSITVNNGVTVHGRALARNGAVTLNGDVFTSPACADDTTTTIVGDTTTTIDSGVASTTSTTLDGSGTGGTTDGSGTGGTGTGGTTDGSGTGGSGTGGSGTGGSGTTGTSTGLARTGAPIDGSLLLSGTILAVGLIVFGARERTLAGPRRGSPRPS